MSENKHEHGYVGDIFENYSENCTYTKVTI